MWNLTELFLLVLHILIGMKYQSNQKKILVLLPSEGK